MRGRIGWVFVFALAGLVGCSQDEAPTTIGLPEALETSDGTDVRVAGFVRHTGWVLSGDVYEDIDRMELCEVVVDRPRVEDRPARLFRCGGAQVGLEGVDEEDLDLRDDGDGMSWSSHEVTVEGTIRREDGDVWLTVDQIVDVDGRSTRPRAALADATPGQGTELTVLAFRSADGRVMVCDRYVEVVTGRHPFYDDPLYSPSACADPTAAVVNADALIDVQFAPTSAPGGGSFVREVIVVEGVVDHGSHGLEFTVVELVA